MRTLAIALTVTLAGSIVQAQDAPDPDARVRQLSEELQDLQHGTGQLRADVGASYARLMAIQLELFDRIDGARVTIVQHNEAGPFYRLIEVTYAIDGQPVFHQRDESGALGRAELPIHDGLLRPGEHQLSIVLRYVGDGGEFVRYLEGYHFTVRSGGAFFAPAGQRVRMSVHAVHRGFDRPYEQRLDVVREQSVEALH